jgi:glycosyltransferase involved in cell wall biosynthesis
MKTISVCIATYNGERFIYEQIKSILVQLKENDEVIISDNYSSDNTIKIIQNFRDPRIKIYFLRKTTLIKNFENALIHAIGDYIFLADQDDLWLPEKITIMMNALKSYDLVVSDCIVVDDCLNPMYLSFYVLNCSGPGLLKNIIKNSYLGCCMAFNRTILDASLPFPDDIPMHDWWIGLIGEIAGKIVFLDNKLILLRRHNANASITGQISTFSLAKKGIWRFILVKNIIKKYTKIFVRNFLIRNS